MSNQSPQPWGAPGGQQPQGGPAQPGPGQSGQFQPGPYQQSVGQQPYGQQGYAPQSYGQPTALRSDYAHWGKRVGASLIDSIPMIIAYVPFMIGYFQLIIQTMDESMKGSTIDPGDLTGAVVTMGIGSILMLGALGWQIYNRWMVGGRTGQSLGKRVLKIKLLAEDTNQPVGPLNAFLRDICHILDGMAYIGYLWPLWDEKRQTFADKLMKTIVVDAPVGGPGGQPQQYSQQQYPPQQNQQYPPQQF